MKLNTSPRLFAAKYPTGIFFADKTREVGGDYARLASIDYARLELTIDETCPADLRQVIENQARAMQVQRGQQYQISTSGQTITLGNALDEDEFVIPPASFCHFDGQGMAFLDEGFIVGIPRSDDGTYLADDAIIIDRNSFDGAPGEQTYEEFEELVAKASEGWQYAERKETPYRFRQAPNGYPVEAEFYAGPRHGWRMCMDIGVKVWIRDNFPVQVAA